MNHFKVNLSVVFSFIFATQRLNFGMNARLNFSGASYMKYLKMFMWNDVSRMRFCLEDNNEPSSGLVKRRQAGELIGRTNILRSLFILIVS